MSKRDFNDILYDLKIRDNIYGKELDTLINEDIAIDKKYVDAK